MTTTSPTLRNVLHHLIALNLVIGAIAVGHVVSDSPLVLFGAFIAAVAISASIGGDKVGFVATVYSVVALWWFFARTIDETALVIFAAAAAVLSTLAHRMRTAPAEAASHAPATRAPAREALDVARLTMMIGFPLLVFIVYSDLSDVVMANFGVPSLLQPLIGLLAIAVWRYRRVFDPSSAAFQPIVFALALYALVVFSSSVWASRASHADERLAETVKALFICILTASLAVSWRALSRGLAALTLAGAILAFLSVVQIATGRFDEAFGGLVELATGTIYGDVSLPRAAGPPVSDPNFYARILLLAIPVAIGLAVAERRRGRRIAYAAAAAIITAGTLVTYSRGAMLALAAMAVLLLATLHLRARWVAAMVAAAAIVLVLLPNNFTRRLVTIETLLPDHDTTVSHDSSVEKRKLLVRAGLAMFDDRPLLGVGAGQYGHHFPEYANRVGSSSTDYHPPGTRQYPHGLYFEVAAETGLLGLLTLGVALVAALVSLFRSRRELLLRGDPHRAAIATSVAVAIAGYLVASVFLHETHLRYMGLFFGFTLAISRLTREDIEIDAGRGSAR